MKNKIIKLKSILDQAFVKLNCLSEDEVQHKPSPSKWSKKEILGHLIDSAANNHHRVVKAQFEELTIPPYSQDEWVAYQNYQSEDWTALVLLWKYYNIHLIHVIENIPSNKINQKLKVTKVETITLEELIADYVTHMINHLKEIDKSFIDMLY